MTDEKVIYPELSYKIVGAAFKVFNDIGYAHIKQVMGYLKVLGCKLAILIYFTREGVKYRRVLNAQ